MSGSLAPVLLVIEVWDQPHEVCCTMPIDFMYNMSILYWGVPEAQDGAWVNVGAPGVIRLRDHHHEVGLVMQGACIRFKPGREASIPPLSRQNES